MGFFTGRITCTRFRVTGKAPRSFGPEQLDALAEHAIGKQKVASGDGSQAGWTAGDHVLDTRFDLAKNVINDTLHFELRVDEQKMPGDLLRAYTQVELEGLSAANPSGNPSARQKREARMLAKERLETEARDGRFTRRRSFPLLWDAPSNELLVGTTSASALDRLHTLFQQTFKRGFELLGAGRQAFLHAEVTQQTRGVDDAVPTIFVPGQANEVAWVPDETNRDFLGNEFLLWLWFYLENESDALTLADQSEVAAMVARTLLLECPRGQTGKETISSDGPAKLPEALRAIQAGKLPRKMGLTVVRHDQSYELTLQAETLALSGARLPAPEADDERARWEERVTQLRHLLETLDLMFNAFLQRRLGDVWTKELGRMKKWLHQGEQRPSRHTA
jgi:recombination associated protein RdgC